MDSSSSNRRARGIIVFTASRNLTGRLTDPPAKWGRAMTHLNGNKSIGQQACIFVIVVSIFARFAWNTGRLAAQV